MPDQLILIAVVAGAIWWHLRRRPNTSRPSRRPQPGWAPGGTGTIDYSVPETRRDPKRVFTYEDRMVVCSRDRGPAGARCAWCGATGMLEMDHVIAWSHGGRSTIDNAQLLCGRGVGCEGNWAKGAEREDLARVAYKARSGRDPVTGLGVPSRVRTMFERTYGVPSTTGYHTMPAPLQRGVSRTGARTATRNTAKGAR